MHYLTTIRQLEDCSPRMNPWGGAGAVDLGLAAAGWVARPRPLPSCRHVRRRRHAARPLHRNPVAVGRRRGGRRAGLALRVDSVSSPIHSVLSSGYLQSGTKTVVSVGIFLRTKQAECYRGSDISELERHAQQVCVL